MVHTIVADNIMKSEAQALREEVKHCTEQVQKLSKQFEEIKMDMQATLKEVYSTQCAPNEMTVKLSLKI